MLEKLHNYNNSVRLQGNNTSATHFNLHWQQHPLSNSSRSFSLYHRRTLQSCISPKHVESFQPLWGSYAFHLQRIVSSDPTTKDCSCLLLVGGWKSTRERSRYERHELRMVNHVMTTVHCLSFSIFPNISNECFKCFMDSLSLFLFLSACLFKHLCAARWRQWKNIRDPCCPIWNYSNTAWVKAMNCFTGAVFPSAIKKTVRGSAWNISFNTKWVHSLEQ